MIVSLLLVWIGIQLNAPTWFDVLCGVLVIAEMVRYGKSLYEKGGSGKWHRLNLT